MSDINNEILKLRDDLTAIREILAKATITTPTTFIPSRELVGMLTARAADPSFDGVISTIQLVRKETGWGLGEAKPFVDAFRNYNR